MTKEELRSRFPFLENGKIYLNHAATSPMPQTVIDKIQEHIYISSETDIDNYEFFIKQVSSARKKTAELINASSDRIAFTENTSTGLNILARGIDWKAGDRILLNDLEFPSNVYPFLNLKKSGVEIDFVKSQNGVVSAEDIINAITPGTRLVSVSFVQFLTGYRVDLKPIGEFCRQKGIIFAVDGIQGIGAIQLDVEDSKVDFISCGTQKWLMGLKGFSFIYVSKELQGKISPAYLGWLSVENAWDLLNYEMKLRPDAGVFEGGTLNFIGAAAFVGALDLFEAFGVKNVEEEVLRNSSYLRQRLNESGIPTLADGWPGSNSSGIITFRYENSQKVFEDLHKRNIIVSLREGMLRVSPHFYNTFEEIDGFIGALKVQA